MLFLLTQLITLTSDACEPVNTSAQLLNSFPENGSLQVPRDAVLKLEFGNGILSEDMKFILRQDEVELEIETEVILHNASLAGNPAIVEIVPMGELAPNQDFIVELDGEPILAFLTSKEFSKPVEDIPSLSWVDSYFYDNSLYAADASCEPATQTDLYLQFYGRIPDYAIVINRVDQNGVPLLEENPFFMNLETETDYISLIEENTRQDEEFCFEVAYMNEAGEIGEFSDAICSYRLNYDDWKCGTTSFGGMLGCSTMPVQDFAWMSLALGLVGLVRRRRE
jgi:hypothetical protein